MSYHGNNSGGGGGSNSYTPSASSAPYSTSSVSSLPTTGSIVYILSTGEIWDGEVHHMKDGSWMTGKKHSPSSEIVVPVKEVPEYPQENLVGKQEVFKQVFTGSKTSSATAESLAHTIKNKLDTFSTILDSLQLMLNSSTSKIENFLATSHIQSENNGEGQVRDHEINLSLSSSASTNLSSNISSIEYVPNSSNPVYMFNGDVVSGAPNNGLMDSLSQSVFIDMISRTGSSFIELLEDYLEVPEDTQVGFNGKIVISFNSSTAISYINTKTNATITSIVAGEETIEMGSFAPVTTDRIEIQLSRVAPIPFISYFSDDQEDLIGNPQEGQPPVSDPIYQRTTLEFGKLNIGYIVYNESEEFELGPYNTKVGMLKSLSLAAFEDLPDFLQSESDLLFTYYLIVDNKEYKVRPSNRVGSSPRIYYINSILSLETREAMQLTGIGFIDTVSPQVAWRLKVVLTRSSIPYITPKVQGITFTYSTDLDGGLDG